MSRKNFLKKVLSIPARFIYFYQVPFLSFHILLYIDQWVSVKQSTNATKWAWENSTMLETETFQESKDMPDSNVINE